VNRPLFAGLLLLCFALMLAAALIHDAQLYGWM
jgi:hypothetical protein